MLVHLLQNNIRGRP